MSDLLELTRLTGSSHTASIEEALTALTRERSMTAAPTVNIDVIDRDGQLLASPIVTQASRITVDGLTYRLKRVAKSGTVLQLAFEEDVVRALRRATGFTDAAAGTTLRSDFARRLLREAGVSLDGAVIQRSPETTKVQLARGTKDEEDQPESSWDALTRLAEEVGWRFFIDLGRPVFASDAHLAARPPHVWAPRTGPVDDIDFTIDEGAPVDEATVAVYADPGSVSPGAPVRLDRAGPATGNWLVDSLTETAGTRRLSVSLVRAQKALPEPEEKEEEPDDG